MATEGLHVLKDSSAALNLSCYFFLYFVGRPGDHQIEGAGSRDSGIVLAVMVLVVVISSGNVTAAVVACCCYDCSELSLVMISIVALLLSSLLLLSLLALL